MLQQYAISFYWVTSTLVTCGEVGNMLPSNLVEVIFTNAAILVILTVNAYVLGEISDIVIYQVRTASAILAAARVAGLERKAYSPTL